MKPLDPRYKITEEQARRMEMAVLEAEPTMRVLITQDQDGLWRFRWGRSKDGYGKHLQLVRKAAALVGAPGACETCIAWALATNQPRGRRCQDVRLPPWSEDCGTYRDGWTP